MVTVKEATLFFRSYHVKCDERLVSEWMDKCPVGQKLNAPNAKIDEWDMYNFNDWCIVYGSVYEEGIDDQTKIIRLLKEVANLSMKTEDLEKDNFELQSKLNGLPF